MTLTGVSNQPSYGSTGVPQPNYGQPQYIPPPQQGYPQQQPSYQQQMMAQTTVITAPSNLQQYPNGGPVVETLVNSAASPGTSFSINVAAQHLANSLGVYGFPNAANAPADIENSIMRPLNNLLTQFYSQTSSYDTYYFITFAILMIVIILTMGLGVIFIFVIFIFPYLKNKHISSFNDTVKIQIRNILEKENQAKYMPHGFEWVILYSVKPSTSSFFSGFSCTQEAELKLVRVSRQVQTVATQETLLMN